MRLLLVEDDPIFGAALQRSLTRAGYAADWIQTASALVHSMRGTEYDCVVLDLSLLDQNGEQCLAQIRARSANLPVVIITARCGLQDRLRLLDLGADDYLVKPVDLDEVNARLRAITRRVHQAQSGTDVLSHGELRLLPARRSATWKGQSIALTNREFWLLEVLVRKKHEIVTRERLEETLYGWGDEIESNAIEVYIHHLRRKFGASMIRTVRGVGYQIAAELPRA
jgi:DNA-binding response OmpR family regulator